MISYGDFDTTVLILNGVFSFLFQKSSTYTKDKIDEFHDEKIAVSSPLYLFYGRCAVQQLCSVTFLRAPVSLPQKLLARGVQMESDQEEVDDEVMSYMFV